MFKLFIEAAKYAAVSAVAYGVDMGLLFVLTFYAGWHYLLAGAASFLAGATVAYALSVRFVFHTHRLRDRNLEFFWFVVLGLVGLALTLLVLFVTVSRLGMDPMHGKVVAAGCSFIANFALRRQLLFHARSAPA
jgi:putative flippase GtrA